MINNTGNDSNAISCIIELGFPALVLRNMEKCYQ